MSCVALLVWNSLLLYQIVLGARDGVNRRKGTKKVTFGTGMAGYLLRLPTSVFWMTAHFLRLSSANLRSDA
jgi:hypothetical protein